MDRQELIQRLQGFEWNDIEFKRARGGVPEDAYRTTSVFAYACSREQVTVTDVRALGGFTVADAQRVLKQLVVQNLVQPLDAGKVYVLSPHLKPRYAKLSSDSASRQESRQSGGRVDLHPDSFCAHWKYIEQS